MSDKHKIKNIKSVQIIVSGAVQGVGFRFFTIQVANRLGVSGTVKNLMDGRVEIYATAEEKTVDKFIEYIKNGPTFSEVENVIITPIEELFTNGFKIRY